MAIEKQGGQASPGGRGALPTPVSERGDHFGADDFPWAGLRHSFRGYDAQYEDKSGWRMSGRRIGFRSCHSNEYLNHRETQRISVAGCRGRSFGSSNSGSFRG